jgi:phosphoribosyl 1,2-cyclic phosphodiesterase
MPLHFKSLCSSSAGNCLLLWTANTKVVIDCGLGSMKSTREALSQQPCICTNIDAVLISHNHSDHISHYPLRIIEDFGLTIKIHEDSVEQLKSKHFKGRKFETLKLKPFDGRQFKVGDLLFEPIKMPHNPHFNTYGFIVRYKRGENWLKAVIATDFNNGTDFVDHLADADLIFIESNHDLELLKKNPNPNSRYHMSNPKTSNLLYKSRKQSKRAPKTVILGHISSQRNDPEIALKQTVSEFKNNDTDIDFDLLTAPLYGPGEVVKI